MKFKCALYVVNDIQQSRAFYEDLLDQKVKYDFGENVTFEGDFSIQERISFSNMTSIDSDTIVQKSNNAEIYFETETLDAYLLRLESSAYDIDFIHKIHQHPWGQRVIRFYDLDRHIVEVGERMESVVLRYINQGYSIEETVNMTQHPESFVKDVVESAK